MAASPPADACKTGEAPPKPANAGKTLIVHVNSFGPCAYELQTHLVPEWTDRLKGSRIRATWPKNAVDILLTASTMLATAGTFTGYDKTILFSHS